MKKWIILSLLFVFVTIAAFAQEETTKSSGGIDWVQVVFAGSYLLGVFLLLPLVVYTNLKEALFVPKEGVQEGIEPIEGLSVDERNERSAEILDKIGSRLTPYTDENGEELITITNGSQSKFMKKGLDYINMHLMPSDQELISRIQEFTEVYKNRTERVFTGSKWVIGCAIGVGVLILLTAGFTSFIIIHTLGVVFYLLSSRTTMYGIEKRMKYFGSGSGMIAGIMSALFIGNGVKYYKKHGGGSWQRDWETEGQMALVGLLILLFVAIILGFFAAFLGVINFFMNYSQSFILPFNKGGDWYEENFGNAEAV